MDGKPVKTPKELTDIITSRKAGDDVTISYRRGGEDKTAVATLGSRNEITAATTMDGREINESEYRKMQRQFDPTARMGGRGNDVADGFPQAIQNDLTIQPNECGGPAVDIDGKAVGINIARAERTATYAIPAAAVQKLLASVGEGKLIEPKDQSDLKREANAASREVEELQKKARRRPRQGSGRQGRLGKSAKVTRFMAADDRSAGPAPHSVHFAVFRAPVSLPERGIFILNWPNVGRRLIFRLS